MREAPDAGATAYVEGVSGQNQTIKKGTVVNDVTTVAPAKDSGQSKRSIIQFPEPNPTQVDACEKYGSFKITWSYSTNGAKAKVQRAANGKKYRFAYEIICVPEIETFHVLLFNGAIWIDVASAKSVIARMAEGHFFAWPWKGYTSQKFYPGKNAQWVEPGLPNGWVKRAIERRPVNAIRIHVCEEPGCDKFGQPELIGNSWDDELVADHYSAINKTAEHNVQLYKRESEPWQIDVTIIKALLSPAQVASLVTDLQWAQEDVRRRNDADAREGVVAA